MIKRQKLHFATSDKKEKEPKLHFTDRALWELAKYVLNLSRKRRALCTSSVKALRDCLKDTKLVKNLKDE